MDFPGSPNIERMAAENDYDGLYKCLDHKDAVVRLSAAQALADMNDGTGWRTLIEALRDAPEQETRIIAASMLGELGHPRAVGALREALMKLRLTPVNDPLATALRNALEAINTPEAEEALRDSGYEPVLPMQHHTIIEYADHYVRPVRPHTGEIRFLSADEHLNNAVDLRETEHTERGLVESSLALWLRPDWGYAWYLRGVLFEDIDRSFEAMLAYRRAVELEPTLREAREALDELQVEGEQGAFDADSLLVELGNRDWRSRRDAAAAFGELALRADPRAGAAWEALIARLDDEEREVRHAAVEALGRVADPRAVQPLLEMQESSWLARFSVLQALANLKSVEGLSEVLTREMENIQQRNPVFSSQKDPMVEVEYEALMEIGARAFERTGDIEALLELAESNGWEEVDEEDWETIEDEPLASVSWTAPASETGDETGEVAGVLDGEDLDEEEPDEELVDYVDETAQMAVTALQRLALPSLPNLDENLLLRLASVPDLTLLDLTEEDSEAEAEPEPMVVVDLSELRAAAQAELERR